MRITVRVIPNAKQDAVVEDGYDLFGERVLKVKTSKLPQDGLANKAVLEILSTYFKVKRRFISIVAGQNARTKIIEIEDSQDL